MDHVLRQYDPAVDPFDSDGYPLAWREIKHMVRAEAGNRCVRCKHPYRGGAHGSGEWSACDSECLHEGPRRFITGPLGFAHAEPHVLNGQLVNAGFRVDAQWRILTVHHLDNDKANCRWWNLASLCQRCHLSIQARVKMDVPYDRPHSQWFLPYVAGFYAFKYLGEELSRVDVEARMEELLLLELRQERLFAT